MTVIVTKRTMLVPFSGHFADVRTMVSWLNDKDLMKYSEQRHRKHDYHTQIRYIESFIEPSLFRIIVTNSDHLNIIGTITAHINKHNRVADIGLLIGNKEKQGKGYGTEAWVALMAHLFGTGILKVEAGCMEYNIGMLNIFKKSGMHREGTREHHFIFSGDNRDNYDTCALEQWAKYTGEA